MWDRVCSQKLSFVTAMKSHCLQRNFLTCPCEFTLGLRMPSSSSLPSYDTSSQSEPGSSSLVGVSRGSLGDFGGVTSIGGVFSLSLRTGFETGTAPDRIEKELECPG
uniref:Uncharacterized protein n=1 Tax=Anopheles culicifacies TaxID=139723 RepID=A0A182LSC0_9DIPT